MDAETEKKRKSGLTRDVIVDTAYRMIDRDGMGAFTMRALGAELGGHILHPLAAGGQHHSGAVLDKGAGDALSDAFGGSGN